MSSAPKYSFKGKRDAAGVLENNYFPGPGNYETSHNFMVGLGPYYSIGTSKRPQTLKRKRNSPAPGEYEIDRTIGYQGVTIGTGSRKPIYDADPDVDVGPGEYDIKSTVPQLQPWEDKA